MAMGCSEGRLLFCFFFFSVFFAGLMEEFDLGLTDLLTQITDEEMLEVESVVQAWANRPQGTQETQSQGSRLSLTGRDRRCVYTEEPRTVSIVFYSVCVQARAWLYERDRIFFFFFLWLAAHLCSVPLAAAWLLPCCRYGRGFQLLI